MLLIKHAQNVQKKENGAQSRDRTSDTAIFSRMLYQLSYLGIRLNESSYSRAARGLSRGFIFALLPRRAV